jgi:hypothetical protein
MSTTPLRIGVLPGAGIDREMTGAAVGPTGAVREPMMEHVAA